MPLVVHFKRPAGWQANANIHYWNTSPADPATTWPGVAMVAEVNDWYVYQFPTAEAASIVFNDGASLVLRANPIAGPTVKAPLHQWRCYFVLGEPACRLLARMNEGRTTLLCRPEQG